jgi:hypothetical protein
VFDSRTVKLTLVVTDHEIFSMTIRTVYLPWHEQKFQFLAKVEATCTGKLIDSVPVNEAGAELWPGKCGLLP